MDGSGTLSVSWDRHLASEFTAKSAEEALASITAEPYVNLAPLMLGARGRTELHNFYANHFLSQIPPVMETAPDSRAVAQNRVVAELTPIQATNELIRRTWKNGDA
jgi:carboxymethylenebutenolidase